MIADWGLQGVLLGLWFGWSGHGSRVVRGFCFVKCDAGGEIPAYAGMTWTGHGNDVDDGGNDMGGCGNGVRMTWSGMV